MRIFTRPNSVILLAGLLISAELFFIFLNRIHRKCPEVCFFFRNLPQSWILCCLWASIDGWTNFLCSSFCLRLSFVMQNKVDQETSSWGAAFLNDFIEPCETKVWTCSFFSGDRLRGSQPAVRFLKCCCRSVQKFEFTLEKRCAWSLFASRSVILKLCRCGVPAKSFYYESLLFCCKYCHISCLGVWFVFYTHNKFIVIWLKKIALKIAINRYRGYQLKCSII